MKLLWIFLFLASCQTIQGKADLVDKRDGKLTFKYFTGYVPEWYSTAFDNGAREICPKGYVILEKSDKPTTLTVWEDKYFYWVVKCNGV